jgi:hypothetical protein
MSRVNTLLPNEIRIGGRIPENFGSHRTALGLIGVEQSIGSAAPRHQSELPVESARADRSMRSGASSVLDLDIPVPSSGGLSSCFETPP